MIRLPVYDKKGSEVDSLKVDETLFGGKVNYDLLKQAIVMYHANKRVGTAATKGRSLVAGSTRKLFRQKGTGNARIGNIRTNKRVGGGVAFEKYVRDLGKRMPKKQKNLAARSAVLEKLLNQDVIVLDELAIDKPKTKQFAGILNNLKINRSCLVMIASDNDIVYRSARNIPRISVQLVSQLNAGDVCNHSKLLFTKEAFLSLVNKDEKQSN